MGKEHLALPPSHNCFVCGRDNARGLGLKFKAVGNRVSTEFSLSEEFAGFDQRAHGGIVAGVLDEVMGWATVLESNRFTYTVELTVRYRNRVPVETPLQVAGWVEREARRLLFCAAEIRATDGTVLASAKAKFMKVSEEETRTIADSLLYSPDSWRLEPNR